MDNHRFARHFAFETPARRIATIALALVAGASSHAGSAATPETRSQPAAAGRDLNFDSVLIVTYGRSGSTLLQGLLNSIDGVLVRGENEDVCYPLFQAHQALLRARSHALHRDTRVPTHPWFGAHSLPRDGLISQTRTLIKDLLLADRAGDPRIKCYGFKEIRYLYRQQDFVPYMRFLEKVFPNVALIFNTRNHDQVVRSGWWKEHDAESVKSQLSQLEQHFRQYAAGRRNCFRITYQDVVDKSPRLRRLFHFLGAPYSERRINRVLGVRHSYAPTQKRIQALPGR